MTTAEEAIQRAKAIAARLAAASNVSSAEAHGNSYPETNVHAVLDAAFPYQQSDPSSGISSSSSGKRKRWGTDGNTTASATSTGEDGDGSSFVSDALAMALSADVNKRSKEDSTIGSNEANKRIWIPVDKNPGYNYIGLLIGPGGSKQRQLIEEAGGNVRISIRGRGSGGGNAIPGKAEEPLHVFLEGKAENVQRAEELVNELLHDSVKAQAEKDRQLAQVNASKNDASDSTSQLLYTPKTVSQLLGFNTNNALESVKENDTIELIEEKIGVPNGLVGFIIGKGGESITTMQRKSGAKVQIQKEHEMEPGATMRIITLIGPTAESVATCREIIEGMVQERTRMNTEHHQQRAVPSGGGGGLFSSSAVSNAGSNAASQATQLQQALALGHAHIQMQVPNSDVGLIIGRGGSTIKTIQERTGSNVQIPPQPDDSNPLVRTINITHPLKEQAEVTRYYIAGVLSKNAEVLQQLGLASNTSFYGGGSGGDCNVQVQIPDKDVGMCIGRQGCVIRELQQRTKTRIQIPQSIPGQEYRIITITGPPEGCQKIQEILNRIVMEQSSQFVMTGECFQTAVYPYGQQAAAYGQYYQQQAYGSTGAGAQADYSAQWAAYYASMNQSAGATGSSQPAAASAIATASATHTATGAAQGQTQQLSPDAYYDAFFQYAYHYGEEKARQYYGAWSPPVGTANPYGANPALSHEAGSSTA